MSRKRSAFILLSALFHLLFAVVVWADGSGTYRSYLPLIFTPRAPQTVRIPLLPYMARIESGSFDGYDEARNNPYLLEISGVRNDIMMAHSTFDNLRFMAQGYLEVDLSSIPANAHVESATLRVWCEYIDLTDTVELYPLHIKEGLLNMTMDYWLKYEEPLLGTFHTGVCGEDTDGLVDESKPVDIPLNPAGIRPGEVYQMTLIWQRVRQGVDFEPDTTTWTTIFVGELGPDAKLIAGRAYMEMTYR